MTTPLPRLIGLKPPKPKRKQIYLNTSEQALKKDILPQIGERNFRGKRWEFAHRLGEVDELIYETPNAWVRALAAGEAPFGNWWVIAESTFTSERTKIEFIEIYGRKEK